MGGGDSVHGSGRVGIGLGVEVRLRLDVHKHEISSKAPPSHETSLIGICP